MSTTKTYTMPKTITIRRAKWNGAIGVPGSGLLDAQHGTMCCLGFACIAARVPRRLVVGAMPAPEGIAVAGLSRRGVGDRLATTTFAYDAAMLNDNRSLSNDEKEKRLAALFRRRRITLRFVGKAPAVRRSATP